MSIVSIISIISTQVAPRLHNRGREGKVALNTNHWVNNSLYNWGIVHFSFPEPLEEGERVPAYQLCDIYAPKTVETGKQLLYTSHRTQIVELVIYKA